MPWWRAFSPIEAEELSLLPPVLWRRGRLREREIWPLGLVCLAAAVVVPSLAWLWCVLWLLLFLQARWRAHRAPKFGMIELAVPIAAPWQVYVQAHGRFRPLRLAWLDERCVVMRAPYRLIYADEVSPRDFARLRRWGLGVYPVPPDGMTLSQGVSTVSVGVSSVSG